MVPIIGALALSACSKTVTQEQIAAKRFEYNQKEVKETVKEIPKWFLDVPTEEGKMYAVGSAQTPDLQLTIDLAILGAKTTLADSMNSRLRSQTKQFVTKLGNDDLDSIVMTEVEKATRNLVLDADVSGWQQKELEIYPSGSQYRAYVLLEYSDAMATNILHKRILQNSSLHSKIRSTEAFKELDAAVNEYNETE